MKLLFSAVPLVLCFFIQVCLGADAGLTKDQNTPIPTGATIPQWPKPTAQTFSPKAASARSQDLELIHSPAAPGAFDVRVAGELMALGQSGPMIGYLAGGAVRWFGIDGAVQAKRTIKAQGNSVQVSLEGRDADGALWKIQQQFSPGPIAGSIAIVTEVTVDQDRSVAFLPMLMIFPGVGAFGAAKGQGLFAGLDYLDDEPSSSEADVIGPASKRQVPDNLKITFPLMAVQHHGRYLALTWETQADVSAVFDSPDRLFGSGGHVMGLLFPGSDGKNREEGSLLPRVSNVLHANQPLVLRATLLGGVGDSVVPAVEQYVAVRGLPPLPGASVDLQKYASLAAGGWLDSKIREGNLFRHAIAGDNFKLGRAADAAVWMDWLASQIAQPALAGRLQQTAKDALASIPPQDWNSAAIGHVRYPVASLIYGHTAENAARAQQTGRQALGSFEADGSVRYHPQVGGPDYGKTASTNEANGLTSSAVASLLEAAAFCGDRELLDAALARLRAMDKFRHSVPRGAQTWECPLHTPDILASAHLVRAYTLGYELTGDREFLEQARYWAWTGVPFVYLVNPTAQPIGLYGTIAVFGATNWRAPVWMGLPVQWCGLVYADALYRLVRHDPKGPWKQLADGITLSGIQQTWPPEDHDLQGLLPDSFVLRAQHRNGPAINPATVEACAAHLFNQPAYDFWSFRKNGLRVHAPGEIRRVEEGAGRVGFEVESWVKAPYYVLINGLAPQPQVAINGQPMDLSGGNQFLAKEGWLILELKGKAQVDIGLKP
ncbi:MAG: hypothetical protein ACLQU3_09365 [Limisphaerales bacterium]